MNEVDFFVELITDEKELDKIINFFKETVPGTRKPTFEQKKQYIKNIFKSRTPKVIRNRRKGSPDPFYTYINKTKVPDKIPREFKDMITFFKELDNIPDYVRFGQLLIHNPEETRSNLPTFISNYENGKDVFDIGITIETEDELRAFYREIKMFMSNNKVDNILEYIAKFQDSDYPEMLAKCTEKVKDLSLLEFNEHKKNIIKDFGEIVTFVAFVHTHPQEDEDILLGFAIDATMFTLDSRRAGMLEKANNQLKELEDTIKNDLQALLKEKEEELKTSRQEIKQLKKEYETTKKTLDKVTKDFEDYKSQRETMYASEVQKLTKEIENLTKKYEKDLQEERKKYERGLLEETKKRETIENEINAYKIDLETQKEIKDYAIIYTITNTIVQSIYPEIKLAHVSQKDAIGRIFSSMECEKLYIQMNGLSTRKYRELESKAKENGILYETFEVDESKELIDYIGYIKILNLKEIVVR